MPATERPDTTEPLAASQVPELLRADLALALAARDKPRVSLLRTTIAVLANAEAPPVGPATDPALIGRGDQPRLELSDDRIEQLLRQEVAEREEAVAAYAAGGRLDAADVLRAEVELLTGYLDRLTDAAGDAIDVADVAEG